MGVQASCHDMARFGYMILNGGRWGDEQIVSEEYVTMATSPSQELNPGYGFLWWLNEEDTLIPVVNAPIEGLYWPDTPEDAFSAIGFGDQYIMVIPSLDIVVTRGGPANIAALIGGESASEAEPVPSTSANEIGRLVAAAAAGG
jgi:CubicO group peptidase (beta-lactamase class C family)